MAERKMLGASLYVPATHKDLPQIASGALLGDVRSLIFCTEDAVADSELGYALFNLSLALGQMPERPGINRFVRVRSPDILKRVLDMPGADKLSGFVLPKVTRHNFDAYFQQIRGTRYLLMPTLETAEVFDEGEMKLFRQCLQAPGVQTYSGAAHRRQRPAGAAGHPAPTPPDDLPHAAGRGDFPAGDDFFATRLCAERAGV